MGVNRSLGSCPDAWVVREPQVVIGAEVEDFLAVRNDLNVLGGTDDALYFVGACFFDLGEGLLAGFSEF